MAKYEKHLDYNVSVNVSTNSTKDTLPDDSVGGMADSGFETGDLIGSPGQNSPLHESFIPNGKLSPDSSFFDPLVSTYRDNGDPPSSAIESNLLDLDFFDPLAPLPEEFPSPQGSSSPHNGLFSPGEQEDLLRIPKTESNSASPVNASISESLAPDFQSSPQDYAREIFDERLSPAEDNDLDDITDSLPISEHVSTPTREASPEIKQDQFDELEEDLREEVDAFSQADSERASPVINDPPVSNGPLHAQGVDSGTECDSLEDPPAICTEHELHDSQETHVEPSAPPDRNYGDDYNNKLNINKKKKKEIEITLVPERLDPKVKRSKSEVKVHRVLESEKENVLVDTTMSPSPEPEVSNTNSPSIAEEDRLATIAERKTTYVNQISKTTVSTEQKEIIETGVSIKQLKVSYDSDVSKEEIHQLQYKENIETGVSIENLKSTYLHNGQSEGRESASPVDSHSIGIDFKTLKENYVNQLQSEESEQYKEKIETGVSIKDLRASYCDITKAVEEPVSSPKRIDRISPHAQRARSVGDLSKLEIMNGLVENGYSNHHGPTWSSKTKSHSDLSSEDDVSNGPASDSEAIYTGVSVKALRASYCDLVKLEDQLGKPRPIVKTGISIKSLKSSFSVSDANDDVGVKIDRARITRSFSQDVYPLYALLDANDAVLGRDEKGNLCRICGRPVFLMDRIKAEKSIFHKTCFRCKECNKQLTVDSYSSHEGVLYCKLHFKQLFQPKIKFEDDGPRFTRKRHEMIIKENTPLELPPDVVRSSDKPDYGLEELPSLRNLKSRFESSDESDLVRSPSQVSVKRSESILSKMAKFQSSENGHYEDSSSEDEESQDPDVIRETKKKEKLQIQVQESSQEVVFSGMSDLKTQWESGSVNSKEEWAKETQEELNKLRQRICHMSPEGKGNLKAVYENAIHEAEKVTTTKESTLEMEIREISSIKEKWERGDVLNEAEQEKLDKFNKDREDDLSVFKDSGNSAEARTLFKKIDETVVKSGTPITLKKSPSLERSRSSREIFYNHTQSLNDVEVVKSGEKKEEIVVDPTELHQKFKFFENYQEQTQQTERKRFTMTPPREVSKEDSVEREVARDPNIVRACDQESDIPITDTARKMLNKFREMESKSETEETPAGPKPLKRITPPREYTLPQPSDHESSPEPERDPNIVRCSDKIEDTILIEAEKTRSLRAKFERWEGNNDVELENQKNGIDEEILPTIDTTKNLKAKFEALKEENQQTLEKPKNRINRFVENTVAEYCYACEKRVYAMEKVEANGLKFHRSCFKCSMCSCVLRLDNYTTSEGVMYCAPHFKQLFISKGNYDEGFGREQHKEKWNRSRSTTPTPKEFNGGVNGNGEYYNSETEEVFA